MFKRGIGIGVYNAHHALRPTGYGSAAIVENWFGVIYSYNEGRWLFKNRINWPEARKEARFCADQLVWHARIFVLSSNNRMVDGEEFVFCAK